MIHRRRRPPNQSKKLKFLCRFNGTFQRRPPSEKLRYTGGETRILSVDRTIGFSRLHSTISDIIVCPNNNNSNKKSLSFSLRYQLPSSESHSPLVLIDSDDDVSSMIDVFEKLEFSGKRTRLWIYVCDNSDCVDNVEFANNHICVNRVETENLSNCLSGNGLKSRNSISRLCGEEFNGDRVKNSDDSLRKLVLKQQLLAKQQTRIRNFHGGGLGFPVKQTEFEFTSESRKDNQPLIDLTSEPECHVTHEPTNLNFVANPHRFNILDHKFPKTQVANCENLCNLGSMPTSHPHYPNHHAGMKSPVQSLSSQSGLTFDYGARTSSGSSRPFVVQPQLPNQPLMPSGSDDKYLLSNLTKENVMPWTANSNTVKTCLAPVSFSNQLVGNAHTVRSSYNGIRNHRFGLNDMRNQRTCPYYFRNNRSNFTEIGNYRNVRSDKRPWVGKFYPSVRSSSNISKQVQGTRIYYPSLWKPLSVYHDQPYESKENLEDKGGIGVPYGMSNPECGLGYHSASTAMADHSLSHLNVMKDLLSGSDGDEHEVPCQDPCNNFSGVPKKIQTVCSDVIKEPLVDLDLCNLSLSSCKESNSPASSAPDSEDGSEALLRPQSKPSEFMDEESFSSHLRVEKPNEVASNSSSQSAAKLEEDDEEKEEIQQDPQSTISSDGKDDDRVSHKCSKVDGGVPSDLAAFFTHLATHELQTIQNSDLEYIKELGSGTYGTVYYGKWKGSDVAIKRLKPSCFTEGTMKDRLVADFWKEAHMLGQLRHPNVVALYGVVTDGPVTNLATVTEYMVNGSLKQVFQKKDRTIDRRKRLIIAMDAAFGMEYLHEKNIVHFDLKSHNFLVNMRDPQRPVCKIGDLGLSKIKQRTLVSGGVRGTIPWMAPELLSSQNNMVTEKVDVYSFGIVMWELLTGEEPYVNMRSREIIGGIIKGNLRPEIPSWCDPMWRSLMERCWSSDPNSRPAFSEIAKDLRAMSASMNIK